MSVDLSNLRLDLPDEDFSKPEGVGRFWRWLAFMLMLAIGGLVWLHWFYEPSTIDERPVISTYTVTNATRNAKSTFTAGGWIDAQRPAPIDVVCQTEGMIKELRVIEGDFVEKGEVIALVNSDVLDAEWRVASAKLEAAQKRVTRAEALAMLLDLGTRDEAIAVAEAKVETKRAQVDQMKAGFREEDIAGAEAALNQAKATARFQHSKAKLIREMADKNARPKLEAEQAEAEAEAADELVLKRKAELDRLKAGYRDVDIEVAEAELAEAEAEYELLDAGSRDEAIEAAEAEVDEAEAIKDAAEREIERIETLLRFCEIKSPVEGRVLELVTMLGGYVGRNNRVVVRLYDPFKMQAKVDIRQEQVPLLYMGQACTIKLEARRGKPYTGNVIRIDPLANLARNTVRAYISIDEPDDVLRVDMTATVDFHPASEFTEDEELPLVVPKSSVLKRGEKTFVFVVDEGVVTQTEVKLGKETASGIIVDSGVDKDVMIASNKVAQLRDGMEVRLSAEETE